MKGAMYFPARAYNTWQVWSQYSNAEVERDLGLAASIGIEAVRVFVSYEWWYKEAVDDVTANRHIGNLSHFMNTADSNGIQVLPVLFESIGADPGDPLPEDPTTHNLRLDVLDDTNINSSFAVQSPSHDHIIREERWGMTEQSPVGEQPNGEWFGSPRHFTRRMTNFLSGHPALAAIEVMNEPAHEAGAPRRFQFAVDMANEIRATDSTVPVTMGVKDFGHAAHTGNINFNEGYENAITGGLDIHQFHMNLPADTQAAQTYLDAAGQYRQQIDKPLWLTEWQRTREEPPSRFLPHYQNLAATVFDARRQGKIDADFLWGLMFKPAYIQAPREDGRVNGVFHEDGSVFSLGDAEAIAERSLEGELIESFAYPGWMTQTRFPFPELTGGGISARNALLGLGALGLAYFATRN